MTAGSRNAREDSPGPPTPRQLSTVVPPPPSRAPSRPPRLVEPVVFDPLNEIHNPSRRDVVEQISEIVEKGQCARQLEGVVFPAKPVSHYTIIGSLGAGEPVESKPNVGGSICTSEVTSSSRRMSPCFVSEESQLAEDVKRINALKHTDYYNIIGSATSEVPTISVAKQKYRDLVLHPDKRTGDLQELAGVSEACEKAFELVREANSWSEKVVVTDWQSRPVPGIQSKPPPPPGSKSRSFGIGPLDPLPAPRPNFGVLRIMVVD